MVIWIVANTAQNLAPVRSKSGGDVGLKKRHPVKTERQCIDDSWTNCVCIVYPQNVAVDSVAMIVLPARQRIRQGAAPAHWVFWIRVVSIAVPRPVPGPCERQPVAREQGLVQPQRVSILDFRQIPGSGSCARSPGANLSVGLDGL